MGQQKDKQISAPAHQNLPSLGRDLMGLSHIHSPDGLYNTLLFQSPVLETAPSIGTVGRGYMPRTREGSTSRVSWHSHSLDDFLQLMSCDSLQLEGGTKRINS